MSTAKWIQGFDRYLRMIRGGAFASPDARRRAMLASWAELRARLNETEPNAALACALIRCDDASVFEDALDIHPPESWATAAGLFGQSRGQTCEAAKTALSKGNLAAQVFLESIGVDLSPFSAVITLAAVTAMTGTLTDWAVARGLFDPFAGAPHEVIEACRPASASALVAALKERDGAACKAGGVPPLDLVLRDAVRLALPKSTALLLALGADPNASGICGRGAGAAAWPDARLVAARVLEIRSSSHARLAMAGGLADPVAIAGRPAQDRFLGLGPDDLIIAVLRDTS